MVTTDLGACEWFIWDLRRSNLIDRGQLDQIVGEFLSKHPGAEPPALADYLIQSSFLTEFQAERLLQGKTQGFVLGPFTLTDALGVGSMGTVYKATSKTDNGWYAVKVLPRRSMWNVRIARRKVRAFEQCQHPAVVPFVDVGTCGGMHYLAWPLVDGKTLERVVQEQGPLTPQETARYALLTTEGLEVCHQHELFHGLVKPSNLMITADNQVRILDFGIGCLLAETEGESLVDTMSNANTVNSGLDCASPESILDPSNLTPIGDQYSLGCVMYFCLTGQYPFPEGTAVEKMMFHQTKQPTPLKQLTSDVPDNMIQVVERLMQKAPENRYGSTQEVLEVLRPFVGAQPARPQHRSGFVRPIQSLPGPSDPTPPAVPRPVAPQEVERHASAPQPVLPPVVPVYGPADQAPQQQGYPAQQEYYQGGYGPEAGQPYFDPAHQLRPGSMGGNKQGVGPIGMALIAVLAGTAAWFLSSFFFK